MLLVLQEFRALRETRVKLVHLFYNHLSGHKVDICESITDPEK